MLRRISCDLRSHIGRNEGGINPWVTFQDRPQVTEFPPSIPLDIQHVHLFIHDPDTSGDPVVCDRDFVIKRLDDHVDLRSALLININAKVNLFELQTTIKANHAGGDAAIIEENRQSSCPLLVSL